MLNLRMAIRRVGTNRHRAPEVLHRSKALASAQHACEDAARRPKGRPCDGAAFEDDSFCSSSFALSRKRRRSTALRNSFAKYK